MKDELKLMFGEIIKIDNWKQASDGKSVYKRIYFKLESGAFAKTDLVFGFRNYNRWSKLLRVGNNLFNLKLRDKDTIDADSRVHLLEGRKTAKTDEELFKMGVFG